MSKSVGVKFIGVGAGLPATVVTNADLEKLVETSDEWITTRTGIKERRIAREETATGLAIEAARDALAFANLDPKTIDLIIVATSTPDNLYPSTACMVQAAIGATSVSLAFDLEAACTGVVYALSVAQQFLSSGTFRTALVIGVDVHSRFLDWEDRNTCILFGDGAGAFLLQATEGENEFLSTYLRSDGTKGDLLKIANSGTAYPHGGVTPPKNMDRFLQMSGRPVYEFALQVVPESVKAAAAAAGVTVEDIDFFVPHQANNRIITATAERLGISKEKIVSNIDQMGNTSAASIPIALWQAIANKQVVPPALCVLVGFGGGLTWGATVIRWTARDSRE